MSKKPDKYPPLDPREPGIYARILEAAAAMRAQRQAEAAVAWAAVRAKRIDDLKRRVVAEATAEEREEWISRPLPRPSQYWKIAS